MSHHSILLSYGPLHTISSGTIYGNTTSLGSGAVANTHVGDGDESFWSSAASNTAKRWLATGNGTAEETYSIASFGFVPHRHQHTGGTHSTGVCSYYNGSGSGFGYFDTLGDGTYYNYTASTTQLGSYSTVWINSTDGWAAGDGTAATRLYKFSLTTGPSLVNESLIFSGDTYWIFKRGADISGKIFVNKNQTNLSYVNTSDDSWNDLQTGLTLPNGTYGACLVGSDNNLYTVDNTASPAELDKRSSSDGTITTSVAMPSGETAINGIWEAPNGRIWCACTSKMHAVDKSTMTVVASSSNTIGTKTPKGITAGGLFLFVDQSGSDFLFYTMAT